MMTTLGVIYKCACMAREETVDVRERRPDEDVVDWVRDIVGEALAIDHAQRSPLCWRTVTEYAKIPYEDGAGIGFKATRQ